MNLLNRLMGSVHRAVLAVMAVITVATLAGAGGMGRTNQASTIPAAVKPAGGPDNRPGPLFLGRNNVHGHNWDLEEHQKCK